ncbi:MAG: DNA-3-methyladenine glycosylase [Acidimicrobiales bacterium]
MTDPLGLGRHSSDVAPTLLGAILEAPCGIGRIVEVEAYGGADDPASHAFRGATPRSQIMFGPAGRLYVYLIYGMHHCANVVTGADGDGQAVLIRGIEPLVGIEAMRNNRPKARRDRDLANGPGKLCAALGIGRAHDGLDLLDTASSVRLRPGEPVDPDLVVTSSRIGISVAQEFPWRWYVRGYA